MKTLLKTFTALATGLLMLGVIAVPAQAAPGSITTGVSNVQANLTLNYPNPGFKVDYTWTKPVTSDGSNPDYYDFYVSPSATDPKATGYVSLGEWMSEGKQTTYSSGSLQRLANGTWYAWVIARYNFSGNGWQDATSAETAFAYNWPVTYTTVDRKPNKPSLTTTDTNALTAKWVGTALLPNTTLQLSGPNGVIEWNNPADTNPAGVIESHQFKNLAKGAYRLRIKQVGVANEAMDSAGDYMNVYNYQWSDWTNPAYISTPGTPKNIKFNITKGVKYGLSLNLSFKRPSANGGYTPVLYELKIANRETKYSKKWYVTNDLFYQWAKGSSVKLHQFLTDWGYDQYKVKIRACHVGNTGKYGRDIRDEHVAVCGAYSAWTSIAKYHSTAPVVNK